MNDLTPNAASTADAHGAKDQAGGMKSKDTGVFQDLKRAEATPKDSASPAKPASTAKTPTEGPPSDAESPEAERPDANAEKRLEPWMRNRLQRAEEKGRKAGRAEILDVLKPEQASPAQPSRAEAGEERKPPAKATDKDAPKTLADFDYDVEKFTDYKVEQGVSQQLAKREAQRQEREAHQAAEQARTAFERRKSEFESRAGEGAYDEMISIEVDVPQDVIDVLMGHPRDLDIAHYLVHHPAEIDALKGLSKLDLAHALKAIDTRIAAGDKPAAATTKAKEPAPKVTRALPVSDELPSGTKSTKSIADMSTAERIAHWQSQKAKNRRTSG